MCCVQVHKNNNNKNTKTNACWTLCAPGKIFFILMKLVRNCNASNKYKMDDSDRRCQVHKNNNNSKNTKTNISLLSSNQHTNTPHQIFLIKLHCLSLFCCSNLNVKNTNWIREKGVVLKYTRTTTTHYKNKCLLNFMCAWYNFF